MRLCPACSREYDPSVTHCLDDGAGLVQLDTGPSQRAESLVGQVVDGRYRLERVVGRGGMGTVYACRHVVVGKAFAMKVLRPGVERSEEVLQRFIREAQAANAIASRHICAMTDFGQLPGGSFYVVMDLLDGRSLTRALRDRALARLELLDVFAQVAETLDKAHAAGIVHRDLKPDNVVLVEDESCPHFVKLVDFGIAKMMQIAASSLTETGVILGTPYYMSPEQARGDPLDHRTDIYSLGVMMYRAFTGRLPFIADTAMGVITRHLTEQPQLPSRVGDVDPATEQLILRCMEKRPDARYQTMTQVAAAIRVAASTAWTGHPEAAPLSLPTYIPDSASAPTPGWLQEPPPQPLAADGAGAPAERPPAWPTPSATGPGGARSWPARPVVDLRGAAAAPTAAAVPLGAPRFVAPYAAPLPPETSEAATHRGLAASRLEREPHRSRGLVMALGALVLLALGGAAAFAVLRPRAMGGEPVPGGATAVTDVGGAGEAGRGEPSALPLVSATADGTTGDAMAPPTTNPSPVVAGAPEPESARSASAWAAPARSAAPRTPPPPAASSAVPTPSKPPPTSIPTIRSPFD